VHYHFIAEDVFQHMLAEGAFLEHAQVFRHHYGTGQKQTEALVARGVQVLLDIDWRGAAQIRRRWPGSVGIFILPPSASELERRLRARGQDSDAVIAERLAAAREEISHHAEYDYLVVNERFDQALDEMHAIVMTERLRSARQKVRQAALIEQLLAE
jgi:guanylate kinase